MAQQVERFMKVGTANPDTIKKGNLFFNTTTGVLYVAKANDVLTVVQDAVGLTNTDELPEGATNLYASLTNILTRLGTLLTNGKSVVAAGTAYTLTNTQAALDFGTTDPTITLTVAGTYLLIARARVEDVGATFAANRVVTLKLRRTNNTPADITGSVMVLNTGIVTTVTQSVGNVFCFAIYTTANVDDAIALFGAIDTVPSAGSITVDDAVINAIQIG